MRAILLPSILFNLHLVLADSRSADFFVATNGNDQWSGRLAAPDSNLADGPFVTLARARDAVREFEKAPGKKDITVAIRGGLYQLKETVIFSLEDSAPPGGTITYTAYESEVPVFSSGVPVKNWRKLDPAPPNLPERAKGHVWMADLPADFQDRCLTLYDGEERLPRARSEGFGPEEIKGRTNTPNSLFFPQNAMRDWPDREEGELLVIPTADYEMCILPLLSIDEKNRIAITAVPASRPIGKVKFFPVSTWVENVVELLDQPGEWVINRARRKIYLWPRGDRPGDRIIAPKLTELLRVGGRIDYDGQQDRPVKGLVFRGLTFTHGDRFQWHGFTGWSLQHHWEMFDRPTALLRLRSAENCTVQACRFVHSSGAAIRLDLHCQNNRILDNEIGYVGGVGILLAGYGPGTKDVNRQNEIINNWVHHTGEIYWASPAIMIWQSGENHVANNLIHNTPYSGITVSTRSAWNPENATSDGSRTVRWLEVGNPKNSLEWNQREKFLHSRKNRVEKNDIHHVMEAMGDGDGIYISGAGGKNIIRENYIHDCESDHMADGIRCDDFQDETTMERNVIYRIRRVGQGICSKGRNHILNNFVIGLLPSRLPIRPERVVRGYLGLEVNPVNGSKIERNILEAFSSDSPAYTQDRRYGTGGEPRLRDCQADNNIYSCSSDTNWAKAHLNREQAFGIETHSTCEDPLFMDAEKGDFRMKPGSPAHKLGIEPIDISSIGLKAGHPYFQRK